MAEAGEDFIKLRIINEMLKAFAKGITTTARKVLGQDLGFALLLFEFNSPGLGNYISNAKRADMIEALRETADRLEKGEDIPTPEDGHVH